MTKSPISDDNPDNLGSDLPQLVRRAQAGDNAAFDTLTRRFRAFAGVYALGRLSDPGLAQDAVQEAFLEAWVCLPRLQHPAAFPVFLRRILLKRCDRLTRGKQAASVSLEMVMERPATDTEPVEWAEANRTRRVVAEALEILSPQDRIALLLHYADGVSQEEVAGFLGVTVATVKSRLHRARHRLREEITRMEETVRELLTAYQNQVHLYATAQGPQADNQLLERARRKFDQQMANHPPDAPLDIFTIRLGGGLLTQQIDHAAMVPLMERYLTQSLPPEEGLWARWHYVRSLSYCQRHAETVQAHREMRTFYAALAHAPQLCSYPLYVPEGTPFMTPEELSLWVLMPRNGMADVPHSWAIQGVAREWLDWAEETLARTPATEPSRRLRSDVRQTIGSPLLQRPGESAANLGQGRAELMERFRKEAHAEGDSQSAMRWEVEREQALLNQARLNLIRQAGDAAEVQAIGVRMVALVTDLPPRDHLRMVAGSALVLAGLFDLALPILQPYVEGGKTDWVWLVEYAICLWKVNADIPAAVAVLKEARVLRQRHEGHPAIERHPVWLMFRLGEVPEFVAAVQ